MQGIEKRQVYGHTHISLCTEYDHLCDEQDQA